MAAVSWAEAQIRQQACDHVVPALGQVRGIGRGQVIVDERCRDRDDATAAAR